MTTRTFLAWTGLALLVLLLGVWIMPRLGYSVLGEGVGEQTEAQRVIANWSPVSALTPSTPDSADYQPLEAQPAEVESGDTLGLLAGSLQRRLRAGLLAMVERGRLDSLEVPVPPSIAAELRQLGTVREPAPTAAPQPTVAGGYVLRGGERELVEAELMGAEDALKEVNDELAKLERAEITGEALRPVRDEVARREARLRAITRRLQARRRIIVNDEPTPSATRAGRQRVVSNRLLDQRGRTRLLELAESLPRDTSWALIARADGVFVPTVKRAREVARGTLLGRLYPGAELEEVMSQFEREPDYYLLGSSEPMLWAKAKRVDSLDPTFPPPVGLAVYRR